MLTLKHVKPPHIFKLNAILSPRQQGQLWSCGQALPTPHVLGIVRSCDLLTLWRYSTWASGYCWLFDVPTFSLYSLNLSGFHDHKMSNNNHSCRKISGLQCRNRGLNKRIIFMSCFIFTCFNYRVKLYWIKFQHDLLESFYEPWPHVQSYSQLQITSEISSVSFSLSVLVWRLETRMLTFYGIWPTPLLRFIQLRVNSGAQQWQLAGAGSLTRSLLIFICQCLTIGLLLLYKPLLSNWLRSKI